MLESEETDKTVRSSMMLEEDNGNNGSTMLEPEEGNLRLGPETAFLAEGSVHDTGGMVEWAGTVKYHQRWNYRIICYNMIPAWPLPTRGGKQLSSVGSFGLARGFLCSRISWTSGFFAALIIGQPASILHTWRFAEIEKS